MLHQTAQGTLTSTPSTGRAHESKVTRQPSNRHEKYMHITSVLQQGHNTYPTTHHLHILHCR